MLPEPTALRGLSDTDLVAGIAGWARAATVAEARRSVAIAELVRRRCVDEHPDWACDDWDACAAELACVLSVSQGNASGQMDLAVTLRDRLPKVAAVFLAGELSARAVEAAATRTSLITDEAALDAVDAEIAATRKRFGPMSKYRLEKAIDAIVQRRDPGGVRRTRSQLRGRDFTVGDADDTTGTTSVWGRLSTPHAALVGTAINELVDSVCDKDPRTRAQRRADAMGALAARATHLPCLCGTPDCPAAGGDDPVAARFVVHILAEADTVDAQPDPEWHGGPDYEADPDCDVDAPETDTEPEPESEPSATAPPADPTPRGIGLIPGVRGAGLLTAAQIADLINRGARVRHLGTPGCEPEPRYRPSAHLDRWLRARDLTCRHPGCDQLAVAADIDHTIAWPAGPTHPSNTKTYCRKHHLVKTFWPGWSDRQDPDGQLHITTPSGQTYTTKPAAALLFPSWNTTTATLPPAPPGPAPSPARALRMPKRKRTRAQLRAQRVAAERALNVADGRDEPPPF